MIRLGELGCLDIHDAILVDQTDLHSKPISIALKV